MAERKPRDPPPVEPIRVRGTYTFDCNLTVDPEALERFRRAMDEMAPRFFVYDQAITQR